ncbi:unnamed protein product [Didymodactylos carnosus]|uniref:NAD(P)(+)--arginine ADP-ribosyltransferase n=1 Tax=Didymodactylos carnosus TaxID=1234261 RepID=A0A8S2RJM5_9BILA|nr:unnamed protein product [Didymodactylos carnosus]CAF4170043.1 unnamed protein product [Didymodactylos carnosus]
MANAATLFNPGDRSPRIEWAWKSNVDPWLTTEPNQWNSYSDIEADIIERAYQKGLPEVVLDDYHIVFKEFVQISNSSEHQQRPVNRIVHERDQEPRLRKERFLAEPIVPNTCFSKNPRCTPFFEEFHEKFPDVDDPILNDYKRQKLVLKAADGLIEEGKKLGKQKEGEYMAELLHMVEDGTVDQVYACCAYLYCKESFLYKKLNECMRLVVDPDHYQVWRSKVSTFGPFAQLLYVLKFDTDQEAPFYDIEQEASVFNDNQKTPLFETKQETPLTVYRGTNLPPVTIEQFQLTKDKIQFTAFTSTSRSRSKAEHCGGNVLFIIDVAEEDGRDVSSYSGYDEEEHLLHPGFFCFVKSCIPSQNAAKWEIHLRSTSL